MTADLPIPDPRAGRRPETPPDHPGDAVLRRFAEQRLRLQLLATSLAQPLDAHGVAAVALEAACNVLAAPQGWVALVTGDGSGLEVLHAIGYPDGAPASWRRLDLDAQVPVTAAIASGQPLYHASAAARRAAFPQLGTHGSLAPEASAEASAVIPFQFEGRSTGALVVSFPQTRELDSDERWFLESLAAQASQGLERARLFGELLVREERLQSALEASGTGTWDWDLASGRLTWSDEVYRLHGLPAGPEPPRIEAWLAMIDAADLPAIEARIRICLDRGGTFDTEFRIHRPDGTIRWLQSIGRTALGPDGRPERLLGTTVDVTARRLAEEERDRVLEAERDAARLRDAFTGVVSHELRTPITTIFGGARVLARRWRDMDPATRDGILADVVEEADRLYRLVEDLLVLTRVERGGLDIGDEPVHLGRIVERVVASERLRWTGVEFATSVPVDLPSVAGEDAYVEQVLRNLVGNAAKYGGPGSTVRIEAEAGAPGVTLRVLDDGPGIDEAEAERLFELFHRSPATAAQVPGAGIGLFVCRQLIEAMGGSVRGERRPGGGAAFVVSLPRHADDEGP